jgi:hypothetical protein
MATTNLSKNRAAQRLAKYRLAVATSQDSKAVGDVQPLGQRSRGILIFVSGDG